MLVYQQLESRILGLCYKEKKVANGNGKTTMIDRLKEAVNSIKPGGIILLVIAQVDPDAIGAAMGMLEIIEKLVEENEISVKITYCGEISHRQNRTIVAVHDLNRHMVPIGNITLGENDRIFLVDSNTTNDNRVPEQYRKQRPLGVIDHHTGDVSEEDTGEFNLVDTGVTSASTLVVEIGRELGLDFSDRASILLALGIHNDSQDMVNAKKRDYQAHEFVSEKINYDDFYRLTKYELPLTFFQNLHKATKDLRPVHGVVVLSVGDIDEHESIDDIGTIADLVFRLSGIVTVIVWGVVNNNYVKICARCRSSAIDLGALLKKHFPGSGSKLSPGGQIGAARIDQEIGPLTGKGKAYLKANLAKIGASIREKFINE